MYKVGLVVCRYTEPISDIFKYRHRYQRRYLNTENTDNSVRYSPSGAVRCVTFETGQLDQALLAVNV